MQTRKEAVFPAFISFLLASTLSKSNKLFSLRENAETREAGRKTTMQNSISTSSHIWAGTKGYAVFQMQGKVRDKRKKKDKRKRAHRKRPLCAPKNKDRRRGELSHKVEVEALRKLLKAEKGKG